jgi:taurine dioxygenase
LLSPVLPSRVLDVGPDESTWILEFLYSEAIRPGYGVRFKWEAGDFALSDNRTTLHLGPQDISPDTDRVLHLVLLAGELPVSVDGRQSVAIVGGRKEVSPRQLVAP